MRKILILVALATGLASCGNSLKEDAMAKQQVIVAIKDSLKLDSFKRSEIAEKERLVEEKHQAELTAARRTKTVYTSSGSSTNYNAGKTTTNKKKGWSSAAKGTAIGAGVGALGGVLIDKKDGRGAVIGGLIGAGTGYVIGREKDVKSGRVIRNN